MFKISQAMRYEVPYIGTFSKIIVLEIAVLFCILFPFTVSAQNKKLQNSVYKFEHLNLDMDNNRVESIIQDSYGYIWIGTLGGLHKFDGVDMVAYLQSSDSLSLNGHRIGELFEDSRKRLWIGSENGTYQYIRELDNFIRFEVQDAHVHHSDPTPDRTNAILEDENGIIWIGNERSGLHYFDEDQQKFTPFFSDPDEDPLGRAQVVSLATAYDGILWIGTVDGLAMLDKRSGKVVWYKNDPNDPNSIGGTYFEGLMIDKKGMLWIATREDGLDRFDTNRGDGVFIHYKHDPANPNSLYNNDVTTVYEDRIGNIWVCNENGGLHLYDKTEDNFYRFLPDPTDPYSISNAAVEAIYQDKQGRLWIGSNLAGVDVYDSYQYKFEHYYQSNDFKSINNNIIRSFREDDNGNLWIATDGGGLNFFNREKNEFLSYVNDTQKPTSISSNAVLTMEEDANGKLWIGTWRGSINIFDRNTASFSTPYTDITSVSKVYYITKDSHDNMWVGAQTGALTVFDSGGNFVSNYINDPGNPRSLGDDAVVLIVEDSKERIWLGTELNGVNLIETDGQEQKYFKRYSFNPDDSSSVPGNQVNHIFEDSKFNIWIGTEGGLSKYLPETDNFKNYYFEDGLASNNVKSIVEDDKGRLWLGTSKGISKFDPLTERFRSYTSNDGLQRGEFSRYCVLKSENGELIFGGQNGFNIFYPDSLKDNPYPPEVYITSLKIFNDEVSIGGKDSPLKSHISVTDHISLRHDQAVLTFDYIGINFTQSQLNQYAYRMLGFEKDWNYVGNTRQAIYTNLDPGEYVFQVRASNNDGVWNEKEAVIKVTIVPPWWQTTPFKVSSTVAFLVLIFVFMRWRTKSLIDQQRVLEKRVYERTLEIQNLNQELSSSNLELKNTVKELSEAKNRLAISEKMASLGVFTAGIAHEINNPVNFISGAASKLFDIVLSKKNKLVFDHGEEIETVNNLQSIIKIGIKRTSEIINSLTNYAQNDSEKFAKSDIISCIDDALVILTHRFTAEIKLEKDYPEKCEIKCMPAKINQVFVNLIGNAIDAIPDGGTVKISVNKEDSKHIKILVADTGKGMSKRVASKLFDPFFTTKDVGQGSGLGLYLVYGIIEQHNGTISVDSLKNKGTTFTIVLPV